MAVLNRTYTFLENKEETEQFQVEPEHIWKENATVKSFNVLATRQLLIKAFAATEKMLEKTLGDDVVAAVVSSEVKHFGITPVSMRVTLKAKITKVAGNDVHFTVEVYDEMEHIARVEIDRVILSTEYIKRKIAEKRL